MESRTVSYGYVRSAILKSASTNVRFIASKKHKSRRKEVKPFLFVSTIYSKSTVLSLLTCCKVLAPKEHFTYAFVKRAVGFPSWQGNKVEIRVLA